MEEVGGCTLIRPLIEVDGEGPAAGLIAAQSTRKGGLSGSPFGMNLSYRVGDREEAVDANRKTFFGALGVPGPALASTDQVHGAEISVMQGAGATRECDGLITAVPGVTLSVSIADCLPILIVDPVARVLGLVHAGWRGSSKGIAGRCVNIMERLGARPDRMLAHIGPSAGVCCYEVGPEVADLFPGCSERRGGRIYLDLWKFNRESLVTAGLQESRIGCTTYCTICNPELFHSYRRDRDRSGRMMFLAVLS